MSEANHENPDLCVVVLNWNGRHHLEILIPTLLAAKAAYRGNCRLVILDNPSTADDLPWVRGQFPGVEAVAAVKNDYLYSYNTFLETVSEPVVVFLNNDLRVASDFLEPLVRPFRQGNVFAVSAKSLEWDGSAASSEAYRLGQHHGWAYWEAVSAEVEVYTLFAVGGFMAVDRGKFLELGGFDRLYYPAYGEDSDLSLKAWRRGWPSVYQPRSVVWHREGASWDGKQAAKRDYLMVRAQYLINCRHFGGLFQRLRRAVYLKIMTRRKKAQADEAWLSAVSDAREQWRLLRPRAESAGTLEEMSAKAGKPFPMDP